MDIAYSISLFTETKCHPTTKLLLLAAQNVQNENLRAANDDKIHKNDDVSISMFADKSLSVTRVFMYQPQITMATYVICIIYTIGATPG